MSAPCHGIVFRDVHEVLSARDAITAVQSDLRLVASDPTQENLLRALLRAGELDCALTDERNFMMIPVTCALSAALVGRSRSAAKIAEINARYVGELKVPETLKVSRPEGFAFYGLHPLDYSEALNRAESGDGPIVVIGIRSIGLTLGSVVACALQERFGNDRQIVQLSVRPGGHPYDRKCEFPPHYANTIEKNKTVARFVVVDEGPGLSGSSFLSVGEALVAKGVTHSQILFLCSREVDPETLVAPGGAERWRKFTPIVARRNHHTPEEGAEPVAAGDWRRTSPLQEDEWPGIWTTMCAPEYVSSDGKFFFEYQGLGHYGDTLRERTAKLADAGFVLPSTAAANGFSRREAMSGVRLSKADLSEKVLDHIAGYVAYRAKNLGCEKTRVAIAELENMARFNTEQALGEQALRKQALGRDFSGEISLTVKVPVIADGSMMPHQWVRCEASGQILKLETAAHGDNHFFPGPVDVAWDIAGVVIEWGLGEWGLGQATAEYFVKRYEALSGDDVSARLPSYLLAYCAFRNAYCRMAASALVSDPAESSRLTRDAGQYAEKLTVLLSGRMAAAANHE